MSQPPSVQSLAEMRTNSGARWNQDDRTAATTSRRMRVRFSKEPPYSSVRRLLSGERNFVDQVSVRGVNFEDAKTCLAGAARRIGERGNDLLNAVAREFSRHGIVLGKGQRARRHHVLPTARAFGNRAVTFPWPVGTGLAAGVGQLHSRHTALLVNEADDAGQWRSVLVAPDAQVLRTDASLGKHGGGLRQHERGPADGAAAKMHKVPVVNESVPAGVLAHG